MKAIRILAFLSLARNIALYILIDFVTFLLLLSYFFKIRTNDISFIVIYLSGNFNINPLVRVAVQ